MSRAISLFSGYSQKENRTTNYCLLILKMLYEENPKFLSEVLSPLFGVELGDHIGVSFRQQERKKNGIPDGVIGQRAFTIYIETKNFDWFYDDQIERHLEDLAAEAPGLKLLLALGNFETDAKAKFDPIQQVCREKFNGDIRFAHAGFDDLLGALQALDMPKNLSDAVSDFAAYLDNEWLLPTWKTRLDVVNCAGIPEDILEGRAYMCPVAGGAYNHRRSRYFGMYKDKTVGVVAEIECLIELESESKAVVKWNNGGRSEAALISDAKARHACFRAGQYPTRVFMLDTLHKTDFRKPSAPMRTSKQYFTVNAANAEELAAMLNGKEWPVRGEEIR